MSHSTIPEYLTGLENRYRLSRFCILDTVERVMAEVLETRYRGESIRVSIDPRSLDVAITGYSQTQGGHQRDLRLSRLTGMKNLLRHVETALEQLQTVTMAKTIEATGKHRVQEGLVRRVTANGSLWVEVNTLEAGISVTGWCPVGNLIPREIGMVRPGQVLMFSLKKVNTVPIDGLLRLHLVFDRTSKGLLEELIRTRLKSSLPQLKVTCRKRVPGEQSEVWSNTFIPKSVLAAISRELGGEKILIFVGRNREEIVAVRRRLSKQFRAKQRTRHAVDKQEQTWK